MYIINLSKLRISDRKLVGGKAASLGEMMNVGIPVPPGFCVTTRAYTDFYRKELPQELINNILKEFDSLYTERVAVRSSAIAEDSLTASWAGQLESYLNVNRDNLIENIKRCWDSIHSLRATAYADKENVAEDKRAVAVVVQKMVNSDVSGVIFSTNPIDQKEDEIVIEAAFGLGEAIVQGAVIPDSFIINKLDLKIIDKTINSKNVKVVYENGLTIKKDVDDSLKSSQSIADFLAQDLARLAVQIEKHYGLPQDMEWAMEGGKIYFLQSRPITTLNRPSDKVNESVSGLTNVLFKGIGASRGVVSGEVRIINSLSEISTTKKGEILVAKVTTPDFIEAFGKVVAVVTDEGGITSHAAIISREIGIPAVVGAKVATQKLKTGDLVTVNGYTGEVYLGRVGVKQGITTETKLQKLKSTGNDIDDLLLFVANAMPEAGELWPLRPGQLFPYIDMDQALDFYFKLKKLISQGKSFNDIAKFFPHPNSLRLFILNSASTGLKVANKLKIAKITIQDQILLYQWIVNILKEIVPDDPLCLNGTNKVLDKDKVTQLISNTKWIDTSPNLKETLNKLSGSIFTLLWSFYWDYFPDAGNEISGPYFISATETLVVRDWFNVAPIDIWQVARKMPFKSAKLLQIYSCKTDEVFINFGNRIFFEGDAASRLKKVNLKVDGKDVYNPLVIRKLIEDITQVAKEQTSFVNSLSDYEKVRLGAKLSYYCLVDFYRYFDSNWYPEETVEKTIKLLGDQFLVKNKELRKEYTGEDRVKMFDPRNTFLP